VTKLEVLGFGSAILDLVVPVDRSELRALGVTSGSMHLAEASELDAVIARLRRAPTQVGGGSVVNTLVGLAELGLEPVLVTGVGDDEAGRSLVEDVTAHGVEVVLPEREFRAGTGRCLVLVEPSGDRTMLTFLGASSELDAEDFPLTMAIGARFVLLEGYLLDVPGIGGALLGIGRALRRAGVQVVLTLGNATVVERHRALLLRELTASADVLVANGEEVATLVERVELTAVAERLGALQLTSVVTLGAEGAMLVRGSTRRYQAAPGYAHVVDTTGAGDLFAAGMLAGMVAGLEDTEVLALGQALAAEVISHVGGRPEVPLSEWLELHEPLLAARLKAVRQG
jgi:sugar/nucleoside kinase (ribokinase family)